MAQAREEFHTMQERNPWEDSDWIPSDSQILLPRDELSELMLEQSVSSVAVNHPATIGPDDPLRMALFRMRQRHARALLVVERGVLVGIVTDRDVVLAIDRPGDDGSDIRVRDVMTPDPLTVHPDDPLGKAAQLLCLDGVHHLPIVEDGEIKGLVAQGPVLHAIIGVLLRVREREAKSASS